MAPIPSIPAEGRLQPSGPSVRQPARGGWPRQVAVAKPTRLNRKTRNPETPANWALCRILAQSPISIRETAIPGDIASETHSAWTLDLIGVSGATCTLRWYTLRRWGSAQEFDGTRTLGCFPEDDEFGSGCGHS